MNNIWIWNEGLDPGGKQVGKLGVSDRRGDIFLLRTEIVPLLPKIQREMRTMFHMLETDISGKIQPIILPCFIAPVSMNIPEERSLLIRMGRLDLKHLTSSFSFRLLFRLVFGILQYFYTGPLGCHEIAF
jgi:hypothetical protein